MPTNAEVIDGLEASKKALEDQCNGASGATFLKLLTSIQHVADEVGALEALTLDTADYVPQTDPFRKGTADAQAFQATLESLKTIFGLASKLAQAADTLIKYIK
ncbi:MAG: hypothetical protein JO209_11235 [Acidisphaera sp.]|nr:hypothetical protein [Acidisphaera sp.]